MAKVLIVEDEKMLAEMYKDKLEMEGIEADLVFSAEEAMDYLEERKIDHISLILLDMLLPGANGIEFLKKIRDIPELGNMPILVFSNYDDPKTRKEAFDLGVKDYLIKANHTPNKIVQRVKECLEEEGLG